MSLKISKNYSIPEMHSSNTTASPFKMFARSWDVLFHQCRLSSYTIFASLLFLPSLYSQQDSLVERIYSVLILDPITISESRSLPDSRFMIRQIINDTTFYSAFQRLRRERFRFSSDLYFYRPEGIPYTYMRSIRDQKIIGNKRTNEIVHEYKARFMTSDNGEYTFYTAKLYDRLFFTDEPTHVPKDWNPRPITSPAPANRMEKYTQDLKKLLFEPSSKIDIPLMGGKTELFDPKRMENYSYSLSEKETENKETVYIFTIQALPTVSEKETIIKQLTTIFRKNDYQILGRSYHLISNTLLYKFDVRMNIQIGQWEGKHLPCSIDYSGNWKIPFRKPEICTFSFKIIDFPDN